MISLTDELTKFLTIAKRLVDKLYVPTSETMEMAGYKFQVRQKKLEFMDVWDNEFSGDAFGDTDLQTDDWNTREKYRQMRKDNADVILTLIQDYINLMKNIYNINQENFMDLNNNPSFLNDVHLTIHRLYDLKNEKYGDGRSIPFTHVVQDIVMNNVNTII